MASTDPADEIRRRMAELRRELTGDVREVSQNARVMADWTFYVRRFPWATTGVALLAGFMLVPRKKEVISPDPDVLAEMAKKRQLRVETAPQDKQAKSMLKSLLALGVTWAARTGMDYMGQRLKDANHKQEPAQPAAPPRPPRDRSSLREVQ